MELKPLGEERMTMNSTKIVSSNEKWVLFTEEYFPTLSIYVLTYVCGYFLLLKCSKQVNVSSDA